MTRAGWPRGKRRWLSRISGSVLHAHPSPLLRRSVAGLKHAAFAARQETRPHESAGRVRPSLGL
jgi:hypothetical protein